MKSLLQLIHDYHSGVKNAGEEILKRMEPLIKATLPASTVWNGTMPHRNCI